MNWIKTDKTIGPEGTTITYTAMEDPDIKIESRKRHIPHAGGRSGTWDHTTYFILIEGEEYVEKYSLADAKKFAEALIFLHGKAVAGGYGEK